MPPDHPDQSSSVHYASGAYERRKSLSHVLGIHFVIGLSISTLLAAAWICSRPTRDYPATVACGGMFVIGIQVAALLLAVSARRILTGRLAEERCHSLTVFAGLACAAAVFTIPPVVASVMRTDLAEAVSTLIPLVGGPFLASFLIVRSTGRQAA